MTKDGLVPLVRYTHIRDHEDFPYRALAMLRELLVSRSVLRMRLRQNNDVRFTFAYGSPHLDLTNDTCLGQRVREKYSAVG